jgi:hypothetical protein
MTEVCQVAENFAPTSPDISAWTRTTEIVPQRNGADDGRRKQMRLHKVFLLGLIFFAALFLVGCAAGPNVLAHTPGPNGSVSGFWLGLWHGFICPVTLVISLFSGKVHIYEVHNNGGWYNLGFIMGCCMIFGGGSSRACRPGRNPVK